MTQYCPHCGAEQSELTCRERFDLCLAAEFESPVFWTVHHLTVPCYMLQHNEYSRETWIEAREMLAEFVNEKITPAEFRKKNRSKLDSKNRVGNITKGDKLEEFDTIVWSYTIADVRLDDPDTYCTDITRWAESILADTAKLF